MNVVVELGVHHGFGVDFVEGYQASVVAGGFGVGGFLGLLVDFVLSVGVAFRCLLLRLVGICFYCCDEIIYALGCLGRICFEWLTS